MTDELEQMTPNQRRALDKALAALEAMASIWASEIRLTDMSQKIANVTDPATRAKRIAAMVEQAFIEGAYRHYLDHKDGILHVDALEAANARIAELEAAAKAEPVGLAWKPRGGRLDFSDAQDRPSEADLQFAKDNGGEFVPLYTAPAALAQPLEAQVDARDAEWFALADGAAAELEQAEIAITDLDAKRIATSGAAHIRKRCKEMLSKREFK